MSFDICVMAFVCCGAVLVVIRGVVYALVGVVAAFSNIGVVAAFNGDIGGWDTSSVTTMDESEYL